MASAPVGTAPAGPAPAGPAMRGPAPASTIVGLMERPTGITLIAWLDILSGGLIVFLALIMLVAAFVVQDGEQRAALGITFLVCLVMGLPGLVAGIGLLKLKPWGRILQIVLSCIGLLGFPLGTIVSGLILYYLFRPGVELVFSGRTAEQLTPLEIAEITRSKQSSGVVVAVVVALVAVMGIAMLGIVAAIAVPGLLRARQSGNEATAIGRVQGVVHGEAAYAAANGGYYDTLECLAEPGRCLPSGETTSFVGDLTTRDGMYVGTFYSGQAAPPPAEGTRISPSSMVGFAYVVVPASTGAGTRVFCGDATATIRWLRYDGAAPPAVPPLTEGRCPESWMALQ